MNERIQEIAEQNGFIHEFQSPGEQHDVLKNLKKFAELIIKECMLAVYDDGQDAEYYQNRIAKRFGVEHE